MEIKQLISKCDHTLLDRTAGWVQIKETIDDAIKYGAASVCLPPCFVSRAAKYAKGSIKICTVVGFPNGYTTTESKVFEAEQAIKSGADEIDAVINVGELKANNYDYVLDEITRLKKVCGHRVLKIIIETCLLSDEEKIKTCELVAKGGADYLKTSTGFAGGGATREDVALIRAHLAPSVKVKASGGIRTIKDAEDFVALGADRIGASGVIKAVKNASE